MGQSESTEAEVEEGHSVLPPKLHKVVCSELKHITKFDANQLQELYSVFLLENPDGKIERKQFIQQNMTLTKFGDETFWGHIFDLFDEDQNDEISFVEWVVLLSLLKRGSAKDKVKWLFQVMDRDNSGFLSRGELEFIFTLIFTFYPQACNDRTPKEFVAQLFETLDCNHDDSLCLKEFMEGVIKFPVLFDSFHILCEIVTCQVEVVENVNGDLLSGDASGALTPRATLRPARLRSFSLEPPPDSRTLHASPFLANRSQSIESGGEYSKVPVEEAGHISPASSSSSSSSSSTSPPSHSPTSSPSLKSPSTSSPSSSSLKSPSPDPLKYFSTSIVHRRLSSHINK